MLANLALAVSMSVTMSVAASDDAVKQSLHPTEHKIIQHTNRERARHGLRPLKLDMRLMRSARRHARWMTRSHNLQHTSDMVGENIAMGQRNSKEAVVAWMNSSGHRANMLHTGYTRVGAASYTTADGTPYWCIQFLR